MFIIYETIASNDPRRDSRIQDIGSFWHYTVARIDPSVANGVQVDWLKGDVTTEQIAMAHKLASSVDGEITVVNANISSYADISYPSSGGNQGYTKQTYFLTDVDKTYTKTFLQKVCKIHIKNHLVCDGTKNPVGTDVKLNEEIDNAYDVNQMHILMRNYFEMDCSAYTVNRPKDPKFVVKW